MPEPKPPTTGKILIGLDDAGRGTIAGPLVIAAVYHPEGGYLQRIGATDSKNTDAETRAMFKRKFAKDGRGRVGFGAADAAWINQVGTDDAEARCVRAALDQLLLLFNAEREMKAQLPLTYGHFHLLVDGDKHYPNLPAELEVSYLPKGDGYVPLIAAASMLVSGKHDELMNELDRHYPTWEFARNRGYGTRPHVLKLIEQGPTPAHRQRASRTRAASYAIDHSLPLPSWLAGA